MPHDSRASGNCPEHTFEELERSGADKPKHYLDTFVTALAEGTGSFIAWILFLVALSWLFPGLIPALIAVLVRLSHAG